MYLFGRSFTESERAQKGGIKRQYFWVPKLGVSRSGMKPSHDYQGNNLASQNDRGSSPSVFDCQGISCLGFSRDWHVTGRTMRRSPREETWSQRVCVCEPLCDLAWRTALRWCWWRESDRAVPWAGCASPKRHWLLGRKKIQVSFSYWEHDPYQLSPYGGGLVVWNRVLIKHGEV